MTINQLCVPKFCYSSRQEMAGVSVACRMARPLTNSGKLLAVAGLNKVSFETKIKQWVKTL